MRIFLSHSHRDRAIAEALKQLVEGLFHNVQVEYSSDQSQGGGIPPGAEWLPWITERINQAEKTYALLTPNSTCKPWVLWESGAAAGVALATKGSNRVIPITFGIADDDIPTPFLHVERVRGGDKEAGGILRLLQDLNRDLQSPLTETVFKSATEGVLPGYFEKVQEALRDSAPIESLLASIPHSFSAAQLGGFWATSYEFKSHAETLWHADIAELKAESDRRVTVRNRMPAPRTDKHAQPFRNEIEAEVANRHLLGHWKNVSDTRYFGMIHLAVLTGENVMEGFYTCFSSDVAVGYGPWKWVRIDPATIAGVDLSKLVLRQPREIKDRLDNQTEYGDLLKLNEVVEHL